IKKALTELTEMLTEHDRICIVTYADSTRVLLPSVSGREKRAIIDSIEELSAGGCTYGAGGIQKAYKLAKENFTKEGQNRVILCTDGDFNVGPSDDESLQKLIEKKAKSGVFLTVLGFGMGNHNDKMLKILSTKGKGNYGYIDTIDEARKLLITGLTRTLITIAKDVKIQIDFNPNRVAAYRLIGYENRKMRDEDFHDDKVSAGDIGAGHCVTALYEIVPVGVAIPGSVDKSRYDTSHSGSTASSSTLDELLFVKLRYKTPDGDKSNLLETPVAAKPIAMSSDFGFAAAVALFGMLLRDSRYSGNGNWDAVQELAKPGDDKYRLEFVELVKQASEL
ncbi:MAG: vWA domain-containing protein, partial [Thermoguttaceae bacterium]